MSVCPVVGATDGVLCADVDGVGSGGEEFVYFDVLKNAHTFDQIISERRIAPGALTSVVKIIHIDAYAGVDGHYRHRVITRSLHEFYSSY